MREISRARTIDDERFEDWLSRTRESRQHTYPSGRNGIKQLDSFGLLMN